MGFDEAVCEVGVNEKNKQKHKKTHVTLEL